MANSDTDVTVTIVALSGTVLFGPEVIALAETVADVSQRLRIQHGFGRCREIMLMHGEFDLVDVEEIPLAELDWLELISDGSIVLQGIIGLFSFTQKYAGGHATKSIQVLPCSEEEFRHKQIERGDEYGEVADVREISGDEIWIQVQVFMSAGDWIQPEQRQKEEMKELAGFLPSRTNGLCYDFSVTISVLEETTTVYWIDGLRIECKDHYWI